MTDDVSADLMKYVQDRTGLSDDDAAAAITAVREWLQRQLRGGRDEDSAPVADV